MNNWQPIETAPKDGTPVLLHFDTYSCVETGAHRARWVNDRWWMQGHHCAGELSGGWPAPTHWMPLPDPPAALTEPPA